MHVDDLEPGDVLLYSGQSLIGRLIRLLDGTDVTHVGIFLGDGNVGEALMVGNPGINANPVRTSIKDTNWVEVRRIHSPVDPRPVLTIANQYIADGNRYAYAEILLLAVVLTTRNLNLADTRLGWIAYRAMQKANNWIEQMFDAGREPMICSEFVFRCYDQADPAADDPYSLEILSQGGEPRRRFSRSRSANKLLAADPASNLPTIHPNSLLANVMRKPQAFEAYAKSRLPDPPVSQDELDAMIAAFIDEGQSSGASGFGMPAPVPQDQLEQLAGEFAGKLALQLPEIKSGPFAVEPLTVKAAATFADFVTPGDLFKSPSLQRVGRLQAQ